MLFLGLKILLEFTNLYVTGCEHQFFKTYVLGHKMLIGFTNQEFILGILISKPILGL